MGFLGSIGNIIGDAAPFVGSFFGAPGAMIGSALGNALGGGSSFNGQIGGSAGQGGGSAALSSLAQMASGGSRYSNNSTGLTGSNNWGNQGSNNWGNQGSNQFGNQGSQQLGTGVWGAQSPYLQDLFARAQGMSQGGYQQNFGQAQNALNSSQAGLMGMAGDQSVDPLMGAYANQLGRQFNQQILPGLRGQAQMAGGLGSSRAGIGQGVAAAQMGQQLQDFGAQLYGQQQDRRLQAMQGLGQVAGQQGQLQNLMAQAPWQSLGQYASLLGAPIQNNLGGSSWGTSGGNSFGNTGGSSFGNTSSTGSGSMDYGLIGQQGAGNSLGNILGTASSGLGGLLGGLFGGGSQTAIPNQGGQFGGFNPFGQAAPNAPTFGQFNPWTDGYGGA